MEASKEQKWNVPIQFIKTTPSLLDTPFFSADMQEAIPVENHGDWQRFKALSKVRTGRSDHGRTGYFENEIGFFKEF